LDYAGETITFDIRNRPKLVRASPGARNVNSARLALRREAIRDPNYDEQQTVRWESRFARLGAEAF
jgi:hypothetical protein